MNKLFAATVIAASGLLSPAAVFVATPAAAVACTGDVPEEWRRPGGYCDQANGTAPKVGPISGDCVPLPLAGLLPEEYLLLPKDFFERDGLVIEIANGVKYDSCGNPIDPK